MMSKVTKKIENHLGKQLDLYPTEEETVLVLMERISEAQRYATVELRESGFGRKRKHPGLDEGDQDTKGQDTKAKRPKKKK